MLQKSICGHPLSILNDVNEANMKRRKRRNLLVRVDEHFSHCALEHTAREILQKAKGAMERLVGDFWFITSIVLL
jgi:hypothetical protein